MTQAKNTFTKDQLLDVVKQMEMLEGNDVTHVTALEVQFTPNNKGRITVTAGTKEVVFTPTHIANQGMGYLDR